MASRRRGFTLTELLIVIAIIAVLAGLITAAAVNALKAAKRARILLEIKNIAGSLENFKNDYGAYPPSVSNQGAGHQTQIDASKDIDRMIKKAFPRINRQELDVARALAGENVPGGNITQFLQRGMTADEALVFWLGGFSDDPQFPFSGQGGPSFDASVVNGEVLEDRKQRYEFNRSQLGPRNENGSFDVGEDQRFVTYKIDLNGNGNTTDAGETRQINLWRYVPSGSKQPLLYFDASRTKPTQYDPRAAYDGVRPELNNVYAFKKLREGITTPTLLTDFVFANTGKFQIMHSGLDDEWGDLGPGLSGGTISGVTDVPPPYLYPDGPYTGDVADTLTNFFDGEISDAAK